MRGDSRRVIMNLHSLMVTVMPHRRISTSMREANWLSGAVRSEQRSGSAEKHERGHHG